MLFCDGTSGIKHEKNRNICIYGFAARSQARVGGYLKGIICQQQHLRIVSLPSRTRTLEVKAVQLSLPPSARIVASGTKAFTIGSVTVIPRKIKLDVSSATKPSLGQLLGCSSPRLSYPPGRYFRRLPAHFCHEVILKRHRI